MDTGGAADGHRRDPEGYIMDVDFITRARQVMDIEIEGLGKGVRLPLASRSNCMNTRFQIST